MLSVVLGVEDAVIVISFLFVLGTKGRMQPVRCQSRTHAIRGWAGPSADGMASVTGMAKPCQSRIRGWHRLFSASRGPSPSADGPGYLRIIHLRQNRLPCIAKTAS